MIESRVTLANGSLVSLNLIPVGHEHCAIASWIYAAVKVSTQDPLHPQFFNIFLVALLYLWARYWMFCAWASAAVWYVCKTCCSSSPKAIYIYWLFLPNFYSSFIFFWIERFSHLTVQVFYDEHSYIPKAIGCPVCANWLRQVANPFTLHALFGEKYWT